MAETSGGGALQLSHLFLRVTDTDAMIDFYCEGLGGVLESDSELSAPALDAIFGREGVRIRETFIRIDVLRLHTIQPLDAPYPKSPAAVPEMTKGFGGVSFRVPDLDAAHARTRAEGRSPTPILSFDQLDDPVRMFFLEDPDGNRIEMIGE